MAKHKIQGPGPEKHTGMAILGLQQLLLILGSKTAVEFRDRVLENRVIAELISVKGMPAPDFIPECAPPQRREVLCKHVTTL